jgi:hypothetical protein
MGTTMYEYKTMIVRFDEKNADKVASSAQDWLNYFAKEDWEPVTGTGGLLILRREKKERPS